MTVRSPNIKDKRLIIRNYNYLMDNYTLIDGVYVYFVTFTIIDWLPVFIAPEPIQIIVDSLRYCIFENAYVSMLM